MQQEFECVNFQDSEKPCAMILTVPFARCGNAPNDLDFPFKDIRSSPYGAR